MKNHTIKTVQDMIDCTDSENLDRFLQDLKVVLKTAHSLNQIADKKVKSDGFIWTDDSKKKHFVALMP